MQVEEADRAWIRELLDAGRVRDETPERIRLGVERVLDQYRAA